MAAQTVSGIGALGAGAFIGDARRVEVTATVTASKRREQALEAIVARLADRERASSAPPGGRAR